MAEKAIIIGAPRSGTNMLRDVLTGMPGVSTWPCDEINLIWRHGNRSVPHDEIPANRASGNVSRYIRRQFDKIADRQNSDLVVEKTCANSLRVEFVRAAVPEAKFILITRDGMDAAASAMSRWFAPLDLRYTAAKARFIPISDAPHYAAKFAANQFRRRERQRGSVAAWWGPKPYDYRALMETHPVDELAMIQWVRCVDRAIQGLADIPESQLMRVSYEDFVLDPTRGLSRIMKFLGRPERGLQDAVADVSASSVGKGRQSLSAGTQARLAHIGTPTLADLGYV